MKEFHSSQLLSAPPAPLQYLIDGLLPLGTSGDVSGMPGEGKSTLLLSMADAVSRGTPFFGLRTAQTPVAWITGEASGRDAIARDLHRLRADPESDILFFLPERELFRFQDGAWTTTSEGRAAIDRLRAVQCGLVIMDTIGSLCAGLVEVDNDQTRQLARHLATELAGLTWLSISHTNQASSKDKIDWRLHYLSRAGGNGFPGAVRWVGGVAAVRETDYQLPSVGLPLTVEEFVKRRPRFIAFGVSKNNEMPSPYWTNRCPAIFEILPDGQLVLARDGREGEEPVQQPVSQPPRSRSSALHLKMMQQESKPEVEVRHAVCTL